MEWKDMKEHYDLYGTFYNTTQIRLESWYTFTLMAIYISLFLYACTVLDLYLVMKNPFASSEKRIKGMIWGSIILASLLAHGCLYLTRAQT